MNLAELGRKTLELFRPPSDESVSEWADHNRIIVGKSAPEPGPWHTDRAPYQREIMDSFSRRGIHDIVVMSSAQVGKTDMMLNMIGRMIDLDPGPSLLVFPAEDDTDNFSKERLSPTIEATPVLREKVFGGSGSTIRQKNFPGGFLSMTGAISPGGLKSRPIQNLFCDEVDGYPASAGVEGDPLSLAKKRTQNFAFAKRVFTSTPTVKQTSRIYKEFLRGTQEEWEIQCAHCGEYSQIVFDDIRFTKTVTADINGNKEYEVTDAVWRCPNCQKTMQEHEAKRAPAKWVAYNPKALQRGVRSFHLNAFVSPWSSWKELCKKFLDSKDDPEMLKTFYNLELGLPFEHKEATAVPDQLYARREHYEAEIPDGVLVLTMGIDTQDNRLEYEVRGWGREEESWGIQYGVIPGRADEESTWEALDEVLDREWKLKNGRKLKLSAAFMDAGGHFYDAVTEHCAARRLKRLYPIRGDNKDDGPLMHKAKKTKNGLTAFFLNVYVGKRAILYNAGVPIPGPRYMHFPDNENAGYDEFYFRGLISEMVKPVKKRGVYVEEWTKIYERNEPLDCCNYARCAFKGLKSIDLDAREERLYGSVKIKPADTNGGIKKPKGLISGGIKV
ncbi:MAG: phage terminase large subunit family protein [Clostridia bacterium]|nr:phage terminase large subunit family protein [Clostridia bacterium]